MASPAAILNILVQASTAQAITDLTKMEGASRRTFQSGSAAAAKYSTSVADATRKATGAVERLSLAQQRAALGVEAAQTKATVATQRYGAESLQARTAAVRLAEAQRKSSVAAVDLSAAQKRVIEAQAGVVAGMGRVDSATAHTAQQTEHFHTRMRKSWHGVTTSATGYVSALVGVAGVVEGMKKSVEASGTLEVAQGQLRQTVKTADITWRAHSKQLEDYVVAARKAKGFTDVDLEKSLTGNIRTTKSVAEAQKLTTAAMDVARAKGIDLYAAQQQLGRVFLGNTLAIRRLGIQFTPATRAQDALSASAESGNKKLKAQAKQLDANANRTAALAAIQKQYGGDARKYANTTQGQLAKFHANVDALEATVGNTMLPILAKLAEKGAEAATKIEEHWPQIKKDIGDVVRPVEHVAEAFFSFGKAHPQIAKLAGSLTIAALAVHKIDQHTGAFSLLAKVGKTALGGGGAAGGGIIAKITGKAAGAPVYVTNWEMIRSGGGLPGGGGALKTAEKDAEKVALGGLGAKALAASRFAGPAAIAATAGFLGYKSVTDDDAAMNHFLKGAHDKLAAANAEIANVAPVSAKAQHRLTDDFQKMDAAAGTSFGHIRTVLTGTMGDIEKTVGTKSLAARIALSENFSHAAAAVQDSMHAGVVSAKAGLNQINDLFRSELAQFGITGKSADAAMEGVVIGKTGAARRSARVLNQHGRAVGGWIGAPGMAGADNIPVMLGAGEAVLNRHQQGPVDTALRATYGMGLSDLFAKVQTPHYMAKGGIVYNGPGGAVGGVDVAMLSSLASTLSNKFPPAPGPGGSGAGRHASAPTGTGAAGSSQMRKWAAAGLRAAGVSASPRNVSTIVGRMIQESGGDPNITNNSDINAQHGDPSRGLMQTIGATFRAYHVPGTSNNIFDPVANVAAAVRYMLSRYHHLVGAGPGGYAKGGFIRGRLAMAGGGDPIGNFIGSLTPKPPKVPKAPKAPKVKAPPKLVPGINPNNNRIEHHTSDQWRMINLLYRQAHHGKTKPLPLVQDINPETGREEKHTSPEWRLIRLNYRVEQSDLAKRTAIPSQGVTAQIALQTAQNAGDLPGQLDIDRTLLGADQKQLRRITKALRNPKLSKHQRAGLLAGKLSILQDIGSLKGDISTTQQSISDLSTAQSDPSLTDNTAAIEEQNKLLQQTIDQGKQALDAANKFGAVSQSQYGALRSEIANIANGVLGGRVGLGFATPSYPGKVANL